MIATAFTKEFLQADFDCYRNQFDKIHITDCLRTTKVPAVPISGLCQSTLNEIYYQSQRSDNKFQTTVTQLLFNSWHLPPRSSGWTELTIKESNQSYQISLRHDPSQLVQRPESVATKNIKLLQLSEQLFDSLPAQIQSLRIMKLQPDGWVGPHIDRTNDVYGLCYFWIPLHEFAPCLKIFPYGWLQHQFGNMYLFNQNSYVHAVVNHSNQDRYVMIGRVQPDRISKNIMNQYHDFKHGFLNIWKSNN
jgi:hypothetical protein